MAATVKIAVIGAGPVGLSTAVNIIEQLPSVQVTVIADKFSPNTTGDCAAGQIIPHKLGSTPVELIRKWTKATMQHAIKLFNSAEAPAVGVQMTSGYWNFTEFTPMPEWADIFLSFRSATPAEMAVQRGRYKTHFCYTTMLMECIKYLPWLLKRFQASGGKTQKKHIQYLEELVEDYDVIVNCTGSGAYHLGDKGVVPVRGQAIRVKAPWLKHFCVENDGDFYVLPVSDGTVILGGTHQPGNWSREVDPIDRRNILQGCTRMVPSLKNAHIVSEWVGLRPTRERVRLEAETINVGNRHVKVVHNYGHGGAGITLSWGCALDATQLVRQAVQELSKEGNHIKANL